MDFILAFVYEDVDTSIKKDIVNTVANIGKLICVGRNLIIQVVQCDNIPECYYRKWITLLAFCVYSTAENP